MRSSIPKTIRWAISPLKIKSASSARSTPIFAPKTHVSPKSWQAYRGEWQAVQIIRPDGYRAADIRPLVRLNISVLAQDGDRMENGSHGTGGRTGYQTYLDPNNWRGYADEALRQALL